MTSCQTFATMTDSNRLFDVPLGGLDGSELDRASLADKTVLIVNVASRCGLTPQYEGLERLQKRFGSERFTVLGVPCNQFANQEPDGEHEIGEFCSATYGTTFPMTEKLDVNGPQRHPLYERLVENPDQDGEAGDVEWNFEKFLVSPAGSVRARFRPTVDPESDQITSGIEAALAQPAPAWSDAWESVPGTDVKPGDRVHAPSGGEVTVTRIEPSFMGRDNMLALIASEDQEWIKIPVRRENDVEVRRRLA